MLSQAWRFFTVPPASKAFLRFFVNNIPLWMVSCYEESRKMKENLILFKKMHLVIIFFLATSVWVYTADEARYISFSSNRTGNADIYTIDTNGENLRSITDRRRTDDAYATWSPDGRFLAYTSDPNGNPDIYVIDIETEESRRLTKDPGIDFLAAWSPDGQWIAFCSNRSGAFEIYKMDIRGKNLQRLTNLPGSNTSPAWSPDSQQIIFRSLWRNEKGFRQYFLYVMSADGENIRQLIKAAASGASWSPDGNRILFSTTRDGEDGEGTFDLFVVRPSGKDLRQLTNEPKWVMGPAWSPDGQWITFEAREPRQNATSAIYVMNAAGGELRQLTDELSMNWSPAWVPMRSTFPVQPNASMLTTLWGKLKEK